MKRSIIAATMIFGMGTALLSAGDILATVNGQKITKEEVNAFLRQAQPNQPITYAMLNPKNRKDVLNAIIETKLLTQAAEKAGVEKDPEYQRMLDLAKKKLLINAYARRQFESIVVSDSEAKDFYQKNQKKFQIPERVHARHILVKSKKKAEEIIEQLKGLKGEALKKKFIELAKKESTGPTGPKGGDLGTFGRKQMVLPFSKAAFALKKGTITLTPVKTQFGWHVIYVEDHKPAETLPFDAVKAKIIAMLRQKQFAEKMKQETEALKKAAKITFETAPEPAKDSK